MGISLLGRRLPALLIALAAVFALVTPAASVAAPADTAAAAAAVEPAVVQITTKIDYQQAIGTGTGTVIDPGGVVLTNYHVVAGANTVTGTVGGRDYPADLVGYDRTHDIAVLQLRGAGGLPTAPIGDSGQVVVGESTVGLGNARGVGAPLTHETGPVTALNRTVNAEDSLTGSSEEVNGLDRGCRRRAAWRLRRTVGEQRRAGHRRCHRGDGELPNGPRRKGFRDTDQ